MNDEQANLNPGDSPPCLEMFAKARRDADAEMLRRHRLDLTFAVVVCLIVCGLCILTLVACCL